MPDYSGPLRSDQLDTSKKVDNKRDHPWNGFIGRVKSLETTLANNTQYDFEIPCRSIKRLRFFMYTDPISPGDGCDVTTTYQFHKGEGSYLFYSDIGPISLSSANRQYTSLSAVNRFRPPVMGFYVSNLVGTVVIQEAVVVVEVV